MTIDSSAVARDFSHAAAGYDKNAALQYEIMQNLLRRAQIYFTPQHRILDAGCGSGRLKTHLPENDVVGVDVASAMAVIAGQHGERAVVADICKLPFADASFAGIFSSLCLQWVEQPQVAFAEFRRVLRDGGVVAIATLGTKTLCELREAFAMLDGEIHVLPFLPLKQLQQQARAAGLQIIESKTEILQQYHKHPRDLLAQLKAIGATNKHKNRPRGMMTAGKLQRLLTAYRSISPEIAASWEVHYLLLRSGEAGVRG